MATKGKKQDEVQEYSPVTIETNIGTLVLSGKLGIGVKVLSEYKKKAFFYENKKWFINKNGIIHMCY